METFREWLNNDQNKAIKEFYIIIRDVLFDLKNQMVSNNLTDFDHEDGSDAWVRFCKTFRGERVNGAWNTVYKPSKHSRWADRGCGIVIDVPENVKKVFKNIKDPFYLRFPYEEDEVGGLVLYGDGTTDEMRISLKHLMSDFEGYKLTIQHELQHLVDVGSNLDHGEDNILLKTMNYQCHAGEISAFAKQYAYLYYKSYPNDVELDFNKFKTSFYNKNHVQLNNYINFGEDIERLVKKYNLSSDQVEKMKSCYGSFVDVLKRSFLYYKRA